MYWFSEKWFKMVKYSNPLQETTNKKAGQILVAQKKKRISENISVHHERDEKSSCLGTAGECVEANHNTPGLASQEADDLGAIRT